MHVAAEVTDGPMKGTEIGIRYWILKDGVWTKANKAVKVGQRLKLDMTIWEKVIAKDGALAQHQIFNDTDQDLLIPIYWVTGGKLAPKEVLK